MELNSENLEGGIFSSLPTEILAQLFSCIDLTDLIVISATCNYWHVNAWSFAVLYGPTAFYDLIKQSINNAEFTYIDDIFAEPDPHLVQIARQKRMNLFSKMFAQIDQSAIKLDKFSLDYAEGFDEMKEHLFGAFEQYPSFMNRLTSLRINGLAHKDAERVLKLATSLQTLDYLGRHKIVYNSAIDFEPRVEVYRTLATFQHLTSLTIRDANIADSQIANLDNDSLQLLTFQDCTFRPMFLNRYWSVFPNLTYLGLIEGSTKSIDYGTLANIPNIFRNLKTLELHRVKDITSGYEIDPVVVQNKLTQLKVIGECQYSKPENDSSSDSDGPDMGFGLFD